MWKKVKKTLPTAKFDSLIHNFLSRNHYADKCSLYVLFVLDCFKKLHNPFNFTQNVVNLMPLQASNYKPLSLGFQILREAERCGCLPKSVKDNLRHRYDKVQWLRHRISYGNLLQVSENTALFLPTDEGKFVSPPMLDFLAGARDVMAAINTEAKEKGYRKTTLFDVKTPECAHTLGVADLGLHCVGLKYINEKHLAFLLARHAFSEEKIARLSLVQIGDVYYLHDGAEDNFKRNNKYTPYYFAKESLSRILPRNDANVLIPIVTKNIEDFTDPLGLSGKERLDAQKIPAQKEWEFLCEHGIVNEKTMGTGIIGTGKYCDKLHQGMCDELIAVLGRDYFYDDAWDFLSRNEPRVELVDSLKVIPDFKSLYHETIEITFNAMRNPNRTIISGEMANRIILEKLLRVKSVLEGKPHVPLSTSHYSIPAMNLDRPAVSP